MRLLSLQKMKFMFSVNKENDELKKERVERHISSRSMDSHGKFEKANENRSLKVSGKRRKFRGSS